MGSRFTGRFWGYIGRVLLFTLLSVITLGIAAPFCACRFLKWQKKKRKEQNASAVLIVELAVVSAVKISSDYEQYGILLVSH